MTLVYIALAWCAGIALASSIMQPSPAWWALAGLSALGVWLSRREPARRLLFVCLLSGTFGALRYDVARPVIGPHHLASYNDSGWLTFGGVIADAPDVRDRHVNLRVAAEWVQVGASPRTAVEGVALVQASRYGQYAPGDRVTISGQLLTPPEFDTFSYRDHLARQGVHSYIPDARATVTGSVGRHLLFDLRERAHAAIAAALPEPSASLLAGILLGVESGIAPDLRDAFNAVGATHIIAISGFNMTVLAAVITRTLSQLIASRRAAAIAGIAGIGLYTAFVGAGPGVVRAAIMSALLIVAPLLGRRTYVPASLAFAALLMTLVNPLTLWDVGFQLSFAAVMGMALFVEPLERGLRRTLAPLFASTTVERLLSLISEPLVVTLAAQLTTIPLIALYFERLSLASFFVNFLIIPVQAPLMLLGAAAMLTGLLLPSAAQLLFWADWLLLTWTIEVVRLFARLPWASVAVSADGRIVGIYYAVLATWAIVRAARPPWLSRLPAVLRRRALRLGTLVAGGALVGLLAASILSRPDGRLHMTFLDVGGDHAVLIRTPGGAQILVDGGAYPSRLLAALGDRMPFWDRELALLIITQPKDANIAALPAVLEQYTVRAALTTGQPGDSDAWRTLHAALNRLDTSVVEVAAGYTVELDDGVHLEVLHPPAKPLRDDDPNETGMVVRVAYEGASFLLTADLTADAEAAILESGRWAGATVLQLPFHGAARASSQAFLDAVTPQVVVVQVAAGNRQGYPSADVLARLREGVLVYRTDRHGTVTFTTDGHTLWVETTR